MDPYSINLVIKALVNPGISFVEGSKCAQLFDTSCEDFMADQFFDFTES